MQEQLLQFDLQHSKLTLKRPCTSDRAFLLLPVCSTCGLQPGPPHKQTLWLNDALPHCKLANNLASPLLHCCPPRQQGGPCYCQTRGHHGSQQGRRSGPCQA